MNENEGQPKPLSGRQLVQQSDTGESRKPVTEADQFNNLCKAIAEQELFEGSVFPNMKNTGDVREALERDKRSFAEKEAKQRRQGLRGVRTPGE